MITLRSNAALVAAVSLAIGVAGAPCAPAPLVFGCETFPPSASLVSLRAVFGDVEVTTDSVLLGEGEMVSGIAIGTSLRELEQINGRPFHLAGFGFDGSGAVTSWNGGRLAARATADCRLRVRLDSLTLRATQSAQYRALNGDRDFSSTNAAMRSINPRVSSLFLEYP